MARKYNNLSNPVGQRFGKLTVIEFAYRLGRFKYWKCLCECGKSVEVAIFSLSTGHTRSCGCLIGEKHGMRYTREYVSWKNMRSRCLNKKNASYPDYGGRGITICDRWLHSFTNFITDMGLRSSPELTLERIDNQKGYSPDNCKWATPTDQARNRRSNRLITYDGETLHLSDWAARLGIHRSSLMERLDKWPLDKALLTPGRKRNLP